jgi:chromosome segregation ATPase
MDLDDTVPATPKAPDASSSLPGCKRRRLSKSEDVAGAQRAPDPDLPTREELEECRGHLEKLEGKLIDLEDDLSRYEDDMKSTFKYEAEKKIEEYNTARKQREKERREAETKIRKGEMSKISAEAEDLGNDVNDIGKEIADAIAKIEMLKIQLAEETKQRDIMQARVVQVRHEHQ